MLNYSELDGPPPIRRSSTVEANPHHITAKLTRRASLDDLEQISCTLAPKIEQRIIIITSEEVMICLQILNFFILL